MRLLNQALKYLSLSILVIVSFWSVIFYLNMLDEIHDSIDDGLDNYKLLIIQKANTDSTVLAKVSFDESNYAIHEIDRAHALGMRDRYTDTLMYMQDEDDLEPVRMLTTAFENHGRFYELKIINSMVEEDDLIEDLFWSIFWLYVILVVSILLINNFVLQRLWKPFYNLLDHLKTFRLGSNKKLPDVKTTTKEFSDLQLVVNALLKHSLETYEHQKQFIENASHELQTPLAIATNKLETLLEKGSLENSQAEDIAEILQVIERMSRLNKSLLLLTKIENQQFFENTAVSVNGIIKQTLNDLEEFSEFKNIRTQLTETAELNISMDASLAQMVFLNLVKNALFHNEPNGVVEIFISPGKVRFCNTGTAALNEERIFNRFYRSDSTPGGTGLGLAIVKAICELYGFSLSYHFEEGKHCFELQF